MTKYRIIRESNREPLSNWVEDPTEFLAHLASRPEWASKEIVQSTDDPDYDPDTISRCARPGAGICPRIWRGIVDQGKE